MLASGSLFHAMKPRLFLTGDSPHMAKSSLSFVCQNCGAAYNRWQGKCESWGSRIGWGGPQSRGPRSEIVETR